MDNLLIVAGSDTVPEALLQSLRSVGWKLTVTADLVLAKQLLQKREVSGVIIQLNPKHDPERLKILRFVHEFCPNTLVIVFHSGPESITGGTSHQLVQTLDTVDDGRAAASTRVLRDLYRLTPAQARIADLVAQAYPNREIARKLKIKEQSVRNELSRIFRKVGVWNRVELALLMRNKNGAATQPVVQHPWKTNFDPLPPAVEDKPPARV
ncbi:MAG TPA: LuxR C-terminal-related transcriptional regulator [Candidatus Angelobacter sp.]